jgi:hypothetical protein
MTRAIAIGTIILCAGIRTTAASDSAAPVFACNLRAIRAADRPRYNALVKQVRAAITDRREVQDGYVYHLNRRALSLPEIAEWIEMESLCCPFLTLELSVSGKQPHWLLTLTGQKGVKALLDIEFPH